jgi:hypothetical protein
MVIDEEKGVGQISLVAPVLELTHERIQKIMKGGDHNAPMAHLADQGHASGLGAEWG